MKNYINALLSDISYINFSIKEGQSKLTTDDNKAYRRRSISLQEEDFFISNFKVINQDPGTLNGFSATTYEVTTNNVPGYKMGDTIVAYRGTETKFSDFGTDLLEVVLSLNSVPDMITSLANKLFGTSISISQAQQASQYLAQTNSSGNIYVTEHSLRLIF